MFRNNVKYKGNNKIWPINSSGVANNMSCSFPFPKALKRLCSQYKALVKQGTTL